MNDAADRPVPYRGDYSGRVRDALEALVARARGMARAVLATLKAVDDRLRVYPQFGDPLRDVASEPGQERIAVVPPLVVRYVVYEGRRLVCVVFRVQPLPGSGL